MEFCREAAELLTKAEDILVQAAGEARESQKKHNVNNCFLVPLIGGTVDGRNPAPPRMVKAL